MRIIIPVAGAGTRLRPHTITLPKPLLSVAGKPIIAHILDPLVALSPEEVILVVGFKGAMIEEYVKEKYQFKSKFVRQDKLLGLGYAINLALNDIADGPVLIILGDTIVDCDLQKFLAAGENVLGLRQVDDPKRFGIAELSDNLISRLEEKPDNPKTNLAVIGLYYFSDAAKLKKYLAAHVATGSKTRGEIQFTDAMQSMIADGIKFSPFEVQGWYDCGKKETMLATNRHLLAGMPPPKSNGSAVLVPPLYIADDAVIENSVVGPNVSVSSGVTIRDCIVRNSIIGDRARLESTLLEESIIGPDTIVQGKMNNLNLGDSSEVTTG